MCLSHIFHQYYVSKRNPRWYQLNQLQETGVIGSVVFSTPRHMFCCIYCLLIYINITPRHLVITKVNILKPNITIDILCRCP